MTRDANRLAFFLLFVGISAAVLRGDEADANEDKNTTPPNVAVIDPANVDVDFAIQGEYAGTVTHEGQSIPSGAQVVALGDHKFRLRGYAGGLPGDGWIQNEVITLTGETKDGITKMTGDAVSAVITDDSTIEVYNADGDEIGTLKKVMRKSPTLGKKPPAGAIVLFDGSSAEAFRDGRLSDAGLLMQGTTSLQEFQDFSLHVEFKLSYMPYESEQGRSNSGCYLQGRYEVQILDSFGLAGEDNECGAIYGVRPPNVNMCFPPLAWQTYDIDFTAAKFDEAGAKTANASVTVQHNGVTVHKDVEVPDSTRAAPVAEGAGPGPIHLQDHNNPLRFRNIWVLEKK